MRLALFTPLLALACGCPGHGTGASDHPQATVADIVAKLADARKALTSFKATHSTMDYWVDNKRVKGDVLVMAKPGAHLRFAALSPAGDSTIAEMACDGTSYVYIDYQKNCQASGPCDEQSIQQFFGIPLQPDDFLHLALGAPPTLPDATGTVTWDSGRGVDKVALHGASGTQTLSIDDQGGKLDVVDASLDAADGKTHWSVTNTDFGKQTGTGERRVPGKSQFKSPGTKQDLLVNWGEREVNVELPDDKFKLTAPAGLPHC